MSESIKKQKIAACRAVFNHATGKIAAYSAMAQTACDEARKLGVVSLAAESAKPKRTDKKTVAGVAKKRNLSLADSIVGALDRFALMSSASLDAKEIAGLLKKVGVRASPDGVGGVCRKLHKATRIIRIGKGQYRSVKVKR